MSVDFSPHQALRLLQDVAYGLVQEAKPLQDKKPVQVDEPVQVDKPVQEIKPTPTPDFTLRQLAILLTIYLDQPPHTVRGLAKRLNVTKPVITRALNSMGKQAIVARRRDENDKRNVIIQRTVKGALYVEALADHVVAAAGKIRS